MTKLIKMADGRLFNPVTKQWVDPEEDNRLKEVREHKAVEAFTPKPRTQVRLEDLNAKPATMNVICAIISYRLLGIPDGDICIALGCDLDAVERITTSNAYEESYTEIIKAFVSGQKHSARDVLSAGAVEAASTVVGIMKTTKNEANKLRAAESVLSRVGITGDGEQSSESGGLRIKIINEVSDTNVEISVGK